MATPLLPAPLLLDTKVLIYHIRLALSDDVTQQLGEALKAGRAFISVITRIEMLAWKGHSDESLRQTTDLISPLPELPMSEAVIEQAIRIRRTFGVAQQRKLANGYTARRVDIGIGDIANMPACQDQQIVYVLAGTGFGCHGLALTLGEPRPRARCARAMQAFSALDGVAAELV